MGASSPNCDACTARCPCPGGEPASRQTAPLQSPAAQRYRPLPAPCPPKQGLAPETVLSVSTPKPCPRSFADRKPSPTTHANLRKCSDGPHSHRLASSFASSSGLFLPLLLLAVHQDGPGCLTSSCCLDQLQAAPKLSDEQDLLLLLGPLVALEPLLLPSLFSLFFSRFLSFPYTGRHGSPRPAHARL